MLRWINLAAVAVLLAFVTTTPSAETKAPRDERAEAKRLAEQLGGRAEVRMIDGTRADIITPGVAWEVDWADNWPEAVGQSLHYANLTDLRPGIVLLTHDPGEDWRHMVRCAALCGKLGIVLLVDEAESPDKDDPEA